MGNGSKYAAGMPHVRPRRRNIVATRSAEVEAEANHHHGSTNHHDRQGQCGGEGELGVLRHDQASQRNAEEGSTSDPNQGMSQSRMAIVGHEGQPTPVGGLTSPS
jgi:hypothetical protein